MSPVIQPVFKGGSGSWINIFVILLKILEINYINVLFNYVWRTEFPIYFLFLFCKIGLDSDSTSPHKFGLVLDESENVEHSQTLEKCLVFLLLKILLKSFRVKKFKVRNYFNSIVAPIYRV
jgi:hypothetical protein